MSGDYEKGSGLVDNIKYDVNEMPKPGMLIGLSFQHLFAMFGATVLVPILVGIDPAIALFSSGLGTLAHQTWQRGVGMINQSTYLVWASH